MASTATRNGPDAKEDEAGSRTRWQYQQLSGRASFIRVTLANVSRRNVQPMDLESIRDTPRRGRLGDQMCTTHLGFMSFGCSTAEGAADEQSSP